MKRLILSMYALTVYGQVQTLPNNAGSSKAVIDSNFSWLNTNKAALSHVHLITDVTGLQTALNAKADAGHNHDAVYVAIGGTYVNPSWIFSIDWSKLTSVPSTFAPSAHAGSHQNGGLDEIATATAGTNAIPKAGAGGKLDVGWIPDLSATYTRAADKTGGGSKIASAASVPADGCANWNAGNLGSTGVACGSGTGGITDLVQDATPQLGGDLDMNTHNIQTVTPTEMTYIHGVTSAVQTQINNKSDLTHSHDTAYVSLTGSYANPAWMSSLSWSKLTSVPSTFAPSGHAASHKNGGSDEVAVGIAAANAIPKADATGKLAAGWIPDLSSSYQVKSEKGAASGYASLDASTKVPIAQLPTGSTSSTLALGNDTRFSDARSPTAHASTHQNGGSDEIATAVSAANAIPKAGLGGTLAPGWLPLPGATSIGGVQAKDCSAGGQFVQKINTDGTETCATPAGGGNVSGPGSSTNGYLPTWNGITGTSLAAGLPVSATAGANTVAESGAGGKLDIGWIPTGQTGTTVALGNDARFSDARTPTAHASTHLSNGSDAIAAASTTVRGTVTTTTANSQAVSTDDARMTNARTPTAHASTHLSNGSDAITAASTTVRGTVTTTTANSQAVSTDDARMTDARTPTAHAATHQNGGADEVATAMPAANAIPKAGADGKLDAGWIPSAGSGGSGGGGLPTPIYDVTTYGAKGDGATNDTTAIQNAINAAHAGGGGTVYFPVETGCYRITTLTFYSNLWYVGQDPTACLKYTTTAMAGHMVQTPSTGPFSNVTIQNFLLDGNDASPTSSYDVLLLYAPTNVNLINVTTQHADEDGIYVTGYGASNATCGNGLYLENVTATANGRNGMSIICGSNIYVRNSTFSYHTAMAPNNGVDIEPNNSSQQVSNVTFENVTFDHNGNVANTNAAYGAGLGVWIAYGNQPNLNLVCIDCTSSNNNHDGAYIASGSYTITGVKFLGGSMSGNAAANSTYGGISAWRVNTLVVNGLTITAPSTKEAIHLYTVAGAQLANNTLAAPSGYLLNVAGTSSSINYYSSNTSCTGVCAGTYSTPAGTAPAITTASLTNGTVNTAYSQTVAATGDASITWSILSNAAGPPPPGLTINASTGVLAGTPTAAGVYPFTIQASNAVTVDAKTFTVTIGAAGSNVLPAGTTVSGAAPAQGDNSAKVATTAYVDTGLATKENQANKSANTALGTSDTLYPTQNAVKTYVDGHAGTGIVNQTTGAGAPAGACTAPSGSNLTVYTDTTNQDEWFCSATNTWKKLLSTTNTGTYVEVGAEGTAPANPSGGQVKCYFDSTAHTQICLDSSGNAFIGVKGAATRTANQFMTHVTPAGIQQTAAIAMGDLPTGINVRAISFTFGDPAGSALTAGATTTVYVTVPFACTIAAWNIVADAGTATVKFWKIATGTAIPTSANSINTSGVSLASGTAIHSTTVTDFTSTSIAANDIIAANVTAIATAKYLNVVLQCNQ